MINIRMQYNHACLKCNKCVPMMLRIGVYVMCEKCKIQEFGSSNDIEPESTLGKNYYKWLDIYKEKP